MNADQFSPGNQIRIRTTAPGFSSSDVIYNFLENFNQFIGISMSPDFLPGEEGRVILNWNEEPNDLDLHGVEIDPFGATVVCEVSYT